MSSFAMIPDYASLNWGEISQFTKATILTAESKEDEVLIPRTPIILKHLLFQLKRSQFSLKTAFSMTINNSQGQTLKVAGAHSHMVNCMLPVQDY